MHYQSIISLLSLSSAVLAAPHAHTHTNTTGFDLESRQTPVIACSRTTGGIHVIALPGAGSADPPYGLLGTTAQAIKDAIPGSSAIAMPYDHDEPNGLKQTMDGTYKLNTWIADYNKACPATKIMLIGYSSGGIMAMNSLCGTSPPGYAPIAHLPGAKYGPVVLGAATYGEETHVGSQSYNRGTCTTGGGLHPRKDPSCGFGWDKRIQNYCDKADPMCCTTTGKNIEAHYNYAKKYDARVVKFVKAQLKLRGGV